MTTFAEYQEATDQTAVYPDAGEGTIEALSYVILGMVGEAGEVANKFKKVLRDHDGELNDDMVEALKSEIGDVLWYAARVAAELEESLEEIAEDNVDKLIERQRRNTLRGVGDNR